MMSALSTLRRTVIGALAVSLLTLCGAVQAAPVFMGYPGPASFSFSGSGSPGHPGGGTWTFSSMDLTGIDELYYGINPAAPTQLRLDNPTSGGGFVPPNTMTLAGFTATSAEWIGSSVLPSAALGFVAVPTRMVVAISGAASFVDAASVGIFEGPTVGAVVDVAGDFSYTRFIEFFDPLVGDFVPYLSGYDAHPTVGPGFGTLFSQGHGFYAVVSESGVPAPGALVLLGFGLIGIRVLRRTA